MRSELNNCSVMTFILWLLFCIQTAESTISQGLAAVVINLLISRHMTSVLVTCRVLHF